MQNTNTHFHENIGLTEQAITTDQLAMMCQRQFAVIDDNFAVIRSDIREMKSDISGLKSDVSILKSDMVEVKFGISNLTTKIDSFLSVMMAQDRRITALEEA